LGVRSILPLVVPNLLSHVLFALVVIILTARALGSVFTHLRQPAVIGEMVAGVLLGPSLLGRLFPAAAGFLLPPGVASYLEVIAQPALSSSSSSSGSSSMAPCSRTNRARPWSCP